MVLSDKNGAGASTKLRMQCTLWGVNMVSNVVSQPTVYLAVPKRKNINTKAPMVNSIEAMCAVNLRRAVVIGPQSWLQSYLKLSSQGP